MLLGQPGIDVSVDLETVPGSGSATGWRLVYTIVIANGPGVLLMCFLMQLMWTTFHYQRQ